MKRIVSASAALGAVASIAVSLTPAPAGAAKPGVGFELGNTSLAPKHAIFDGRRTIRLRFRFRADRPVDLRIRVVRVRTGKAVRSWTERKAVPGKRLARRWDAVTERGKAAPDGRYEFRVGPRGGADRLAGRLKLRGHAFPVDGPHGTRGSIGEYGAPRSGGRTHEGFDVTGSCGTRLVAARGGEVKRTGYDLELYGNYVLIDARKSGQDHFYAHLNAPPRVDDGERVHTGQGVGEIGRTGNAASTPCHLHFEIRVGGRPIDPEPKLRDWDR